MDFDFIIVNARLGKGVGVMFVALFASATGSTARKSTVPLVYASVPKSSQNMSLTVPVALQGHR